MTTRDLQYLGCMEVLCRTSEEINVAHHRIENRPNKLYRYRNNWEFISSELKGEIYLQINNKLNDPMDMNYFVADMDMDYILQLMLKNFPDEYFINVGMTEIELENIRNSEKPLQDFKEIIQATGTLNLNELANLAINDDMNKNFNGIYERVKVACFTESYTNMPMWFNYAGGYTGVCFEYSTLEIEETDGIFPVIYTDNIPNINDLFILNPDLSSINPIDMFRQMIYFKHTDWSYEKEWRLCNKFSPESMGFIEFEEESKLKEETIEFYYRNNPQKIYNDMPEELLQQLNMISMKYNDERIKNYLATEKDGMSYSVGKPSKMYLGHKTIEVIELKVDIGNKTIEIKELKIDKNILDVVEAAFSLDIDVYIMQIKNGAYMPVPYHDCIIKKDTKNAEERTKLVREYNNNRRYEEAHQICKETNEMTNHECDDLHYIHFVSLYCLERYAEALIEIKKAIKLRPNMPQYLINEAAALKALERYQEAIDKFSISIKIYPLIPMAYINIAICYVHIDNYKEAINILKNLKSKRFLHGEANFSDELRNHVELNETLNKFPSFKELLRKYSDLYVWDK